MKQYTYNDTTYYVKEDKVDGQTFIDIERGVFGDDNFLRGFICENGEGSFTTFVCNPEGFIPEQLLYKQSCDDVLLSRGQVEGKVISGVDELKELWESKQ